VRRLAAGLATSLVLICAGRAHAQAKPDPCSGEQAVPNEPAGTPPPDMQPKAAEPAATTPVSEPATAMPEPVIEQEAVPPPWSPSSGAPGVTNGTATPSAVTIDGFKVAVGGYVQPQFRLKQNDPVVGNDQDGFTVKRARVLARGVAAMGSYNVGMYLEADTTPQFLLLDAYAWAARLLPSNGMVSLYAGQMYAPFSRQTMLPDSARAFVDKPDMTSIAPDRQIGTKLLVRVPHVPQLQIWGGVFDGEGKNQVSNIDEHFMWVGRVELRPIGWDRDTNQESAFPGTYLTIAADVARNVIVATATGEETDTYYGADIAGAWHGISGTAEYIQVNHVFAAGSPLPNYHANGDDVQLSYLLPLSGSLRDKVEVGVRLDEIDRNDTIPIVTKGDPNQSLRYYTVGLSYYQWHHRLKLQAMAQHIQEVEDRDAAGNDASYPNDQILVQATYRME
jgi:hypothetical protein